MENTKDSQLSAIIYLFRFMLFVLIFLLVVLFNRVPQLVMPIGLLLLLFGVFSFGYGMQNMKKFKEVIDYEKMQFFRKERYGKDVRTFMQSLGFTGLWSILIGLLSLCPTVNSLLRK